MNPAVAPGARAARRARTETLLLDAAETLFAARGYDGAGVRDITTLAGLRLAAVNDAYGGKDGLYRAVLRRRAEPLDADRRARLAAIDERAGDEALPAVIDAFCLPMVERAASDVAWRRYFRILTQLAHAPQPIQQVVAADYNRLAADFVARLRQLFPDAPDTAPYNAYLFLVACSLDVCSDDKRLDALTGNRHRSADVAARAAALRTFARAGMAALLD